MPKIKNLTKWTHRDAASYYPKAVELFGYPLEVANVPGGLCLWKTRGLFSEHILRDESVRHCVPAKHRDFFYSTVKFYVPPKKLIDVLKISGSIQYDGLKKGLTARCASIGANIATLYLGMKVASGEYNIKHVKSAGLYGSHIRGDSLSYDNMKKEMRRMKTENRKKYKDVINKPYYGLAFSKCPPKRSKK